MTKSMEPGVEHVAGPTGTDALQACARCGAVLGDYRSSMVTAGTPRRSPWRVGSAVYVHGRTSSAVPFGTVVVCSAQGDGTAGVPVDQTEERVLTLLTRAKA